MKVYDTTSQAYLGTLADVLTNFDYTPSPRGMKTLEKLDYTFKVDCPDINPIKTYDEERNKVIASYSKKEFDLYESMTNDVKDFAKASKFWNKLANPDGTVNSAYGYLIWKLHSHGSDYENFDKIRNLEQAHADGIIEYTELINEANKLALDTQRTPWEWAKTCLENDIDTRQAILRFSLPTHQWIGNKDQTCTLHGNFLIRENKLHLSIVMRSNDLMKGLVYDLPWFVSLIYKMVDELKPIYPDLQIGSYTHTVHSMHIYEKDVPIIKKMLGWK